MTKTYQLDRDTELALVEVVNIALGFAAGPLSELIGKHVILSAPTVELFGVEQIPTRVEELVGYDARVHLVGQAFRPELRGECWLVIHDPSKLIPSQVLGTEEAASVADDRAVVLELSNIVIGACIGRISEVLDTSTSFSPPILHLHQSPVGEMSALLAQEFDAVLMIRTTFELEHEEPVNGIILVLLPESILEWLSSALDHFVEG